MRAFLISLLALATAACGSGGQNGATTANAANAAEPAGNRVASLPEGQRNAVFIRAIRDAGLDCQHVERAVPAGIIQTMPAWRATCRGGGEWTIVIAPDGTAQILPEQATTGGNAASGGNRL